MSVRDEILAPFAAPEMRAALDAVARLCMRDACDHDPDLCAHAVNVMTPLEFAQWVDREIRRRGHTGHSEQARVHMSDAKIRRQVERTGSMQAVSAA